MEWTSPEVLKTSSCAPPTPGRLSPSWLPRASEMAQLNPELMMVVEGRDPCPSWDCAEGRGRQPGCWEQPCIIAASRKSVCTVFQEDFFDKTSPRLIL